MSISQEHIASVDEDRIVPVLSEKGNETNETNPFSLVIQKMLTAVRGKDHKINIERVQYVLELIADSFRENGLFSEAHPHFTEYQGSARRFLEKSYIPYKLQKPAKLKQDAKIDVKTALVKKAFNEPTSALDLILDNHRKSLTEIESPSLRDKQSELILRGFADILSNEYLDWAIGLEEVERKEALAYFDRLFNSVSSKIILGLDIGEAGLGTLGLDIPISVANLLYCLHKSKKAPLQAKKKIIKVHAADAVISQGSELLLGYLSGGVGLPVSVLADFLYKANRYSLNIMLDVFESLIAAQKIKGQDAIKFEKTLANCRDEISKLQSANMLEVFKVYASYFSNKVNKALTGKTAPKQLPPTK